MGCPDPMVTIWNAYRASVRRQRGSVGRLVAKCDAAMADDDRRDGLPPKPVTPFGVTPLAGRLRGAREQAGLTQQELASKARVAVRTVAGAEGGEHVPSWRTLSRLANALGLPGGMTDLLGG